jgi:hypothetical protein
MLALIKDLLVKGLREHTFATYMAHCCKVVHVVQKVVWFLGRVDNVSCMSEQMPDEESVGLVFSPKLVDK